MRFKFAALAFVSALQCAMCAPLASADTIAFSDVTLGQAGTGGLNLGIFVTGPTVMNASNSSTAFNTNLGLANGASTNFSGGGTLTGTLYKDPGATLQANLASQFNVLGGISTQSLAQAVTDVQNAAANAASLTADQTINANVGGSALSIFATGATNAAGGHNTVVDINGDISITNPSKDLSIVGGANDYFIINVFGSISVSNGGILSSGLLPSSHILFNVQDEINTVNDVSLTNGTSVLTGTYLATGVGQKITLAPGTLFGAIIGYQIQTSSGPTVNGATYTPPGVSNPPSPAPLPNTVWGGLGLLGLIGASHFRSRHAITALASVSR